MNENEIINIPYVVFESAQYRNERTIRRLIITLIVTIVFMFASNAIWLYAWMQYDYTGETYEQDGEGYNNINTGMQGDVNYEPDIDDTQEAPQAAWDEGNESAED